MPITVNDGGVLRTHSAEFENVGGVIREKFSVVVNDGGVLREIFHANKGATVEGITPLVAAEDHIVIVDSGSFTLSAPAGAKIIVGGAAKETSGGNVAEYTLESAIKNAQCTVQCGAVNSGNATTLTIDGTAYGSGSVKQIIQSKWGPIGGDGGTLFLGNTSSGYAKVTDGTGAGGGGGQTYYDNRQLTRGSGGNKGGYGNFGGNGGHSAAHETANGEDGASGKGGSYDTSGKCFGGGGGGFSAGGGSGQYPAGSGQGGAGIVVIEW